MCRVFVYWDPGCLYRTCHISVPAGVSGGMVDPQCVLCVYGMLKYERGDKFIWLELGEKVTKVDCGFTPV